MVVTIPVYSELYISRLQHTSTVGHPSTVGIPMNHNFSLPLFFLLSSISTTMCVVAVTLTVAVQDHRCPSYTLYIGYSRSISSSLSHTFFDQALSVVVFFSFQHKILCTHNALHYSGAFATTLYRYTSNKTYYGCSRPSQQTRPNSFSPDATFLDSYHTLRHVTARKFNWQAVQIFPNLLRFRSPCS